MANIIFFSLVIPILIFILYLGFSAFKKGFSAKASKNLETNDEHLTDELNKLNDLFKKGVLTQEEFEKAKNKILDD